MLNAQYEVLPQDDSTQGKCHANKRLLNIAKTRSQVNCCWASFLVLSVCINVIFFVFALSRTGRATIGIADQPLVGFHDRLNLPYPNRSRPIENDLMLDDPRFNLEHGFVAVDLAEAESHGFPRAQPWPWDESKGIYLLNSWHNLHCVVALRKSIKSAFEGKKQDDPAQLNHLLHCLRILGDDILCAADDTLRYTGRLYEQVNEAVPHSGFGQKRKCRNWDELYVWALNNSACYNDKRDQPDLPTLERYKFCPDGSQPWKNIS